MVVYKRIKIRITTPKKISLFSLSWRSPKDVTILNTANDKGIELDMIIISNFVLASIIFTPKPTLNSVIIYCSYLTHSFIFFYKKTAEFTC